MTLATVQDVSRLLREGRAEEALESAAALLGSETDDPALIDLAARAALKLSRRDEALELLERQRRLFIRIKVRPRAYYELGMQFARPVHWSRLKRLSRGRPTCEEIYPYRRLPTPRCCWSWDANDKPLRSRPALSIR